MDTTAFQRALLAAGFKLPKFGADGGFGGETRDAMQAFQRAKGLPVTWPKTMAEVDAETIKALQAAIAEMRPVAVKPAGPAPVGMLTPSIIRAVAPGARADIIAELVSAGDRFAAAGITSRRIMAHFLSETATESGGFEKLEESLNYSVEGLMKTFSRSRISAAQCQALGRKPGRAAQHEQIANVIYGGAWGLKNLGNTQPGDGWRYRGGGILQNTGRANYRRAGFEDNPEALRHPAGALAAALKFWTDNDLSRIAATGSVAQVRKVVNGGANGLEEAEGYFAKACRALGA